MTLLGMLASTTAQLGLMDAAGLMGALPEGSLFALLAEHGDRIVRDEDFAECYSERMGRPSIPPSLLAKVLLLQYRCGLSDEQAVESVAWDLRWKVALGLAVDHRGWHPTSLTKYRARLLLHGKERLALENTLRLAEELGLLDAPAEQIVALVEDAAHEDRELRSERCRLVDRQVIAQRLQERAQHPIGVILTITSVLSSSARSLIQTCAFSTLRSMMSTWVTVIRISLQSEVSAYGLRHAIVPGARSVRIGISSHRDSWVAPVALESCDWKDRRDELSDADTRGCPPHRGDSEAAGAGAHARAARLVRVCVAGAAPLLGSRDGGGGEGDRAGGAVARGGRGWACRGDHQGSRPFLAVRAALQGSEFDEVIVSTLPRRVSHWLRLDLPARVERLGVPVTVVEAMQSDRAWEA